MIKIRSVNNVMSQSSVNQIYVELIHIHIHNYINKKNVNLYKMEAYFEIIL